MLCFGVLLAAIVHGTTWWLRKQNLNLAALFGALIFVGTLPVFVMLWFADGPIDVAARTSKTAAIEAAHERVNYLVFIAILLAIIGAVGLYHNFMLRRRFGWSSWLRATLAVWFELGLAFFVGSMLFTLSESWLATMPADYSFWPTFAFSLMLLLLSLTVPITRKMGARFRPHSTISDGVK